MTVILGCPWTEAAVFNTDMVTDSFDIHRVVHLGTDSCPFQDSKIPCVICQVVKLVVDISILFLFAMLSKIMLHVIHSFDRMFYILTTDKSNFQGLRDVDGLNFNLVRN